MGRPKGSKNKTEAAPVEAAPEVKKSEAKPESIPDIGAGHANSPGSDDAREAAYDNYEASKSDAEELGPMEIIAKMGDAVGDPLPEAVDEDADRVARTDKVNSKPITQDDLDTTKKTETSPEDEVAGLKEPEDKDKDKEQKVVPLDALHEEREKRKHQRKVSEELEVKNAELHEQLREVLQDAKRKSESESTEFMSAEEKALNKIKSDMEDLKMDRNQREERDKAASIKTAQGQLEADIEDTSKKLEEMGFPGFKFLAGKVGDEILRLVGEDPDNAYLQNPDGWMKVYKEIIFPPVKKAFAVEEKNELFDKKLEAKKNSSLITSPGSTDKKVDSQKSEEWTYQDYVDDKRKGLINS